MNSVIRPAIALFVIMTAITGVVYPLFVTLVAQGVFPGNANGSIIRDAENKVVGSDLIGQPFDGPEYFWGRPSATSPMGYNGGSSSGSNQGPTNPDLLKAIADRVDAIKKAHPDQTGTVPADLVTASASGLDPHISPAAAEYQANRVAKERNVTVEKVRELIAQFTSDRTLGLLGESRVNVLMLNRELNVRYPLMK